MSQFNFPRINFNGKCLLDPATGNNSWYLPLVIFDAIEAKICLPPRVYLFGPYLQKGKSLEDVKKVLPAGVLIKEDKNLFIDQAFYIEIEPVCDVNSFRSWARTPLGEHALDKDYHALYKLVYVPSNRTCLLGTTPGYWNFYGSMSFSYRDVFVTSVAIDFGDNEHENLIKPGDPVIPKVLKDILGAKLTMNTDLQDESTNSSVLVDLLPTMSLHTQIFTDRLSLFKGDAVVFSGKPLKASLRNLNAFRIVNENMPFGGSGIFYSVIPLENLDARLSSGILALFKEYGDHTKNLKGLFIRQVVGEIEEERNFDYRERGSVPNPATGKLSGSISPWYEGEMVSWPGGRQLIGEAPYILGKTSDYQAPVSILTPCPFAIHPVRGLVQLDLLNNFPLVNKVDPQSLQQPSPYNKNIYETYELGDVTFYFEDPKSTEDSPQKVLVGSINVSEEKLKREDVYNNGGMVYLRLPEHHLNNEKFNTWDLIAYSKNNLGENVKIWKESPIVVISDQSAMYSNQGDDPAKGYRVYSAKKEHCTLRIFNRGIPQSTPITLSIFVYKMVASGSTKISELYRIEKYKDGDVISFETAKPVNALYLFLPFRTTQPPAPGYPAAIAQTGFFVNHKVLPRHDFEKYFDPKHPDYIAEVTFEYIFENVLKTFALLAPTMDFWESRYANPSMAAALVERISLENWDSARFMPVSRDLSDDQILLLKKWASKYISLIIEEKYANPTSSDHHHLIHLKGKEFFKK